MRARNRFTHRPLAAVGVGLLIVAAFAPAVFAADAVPAANIETFLGLGVGALDGIGGPAFNGSALRTTITANRGDVLSFQMNFLTNENPASLGDLINDFAFISVDGSNPTVLAQVATTPLVASSAMGFMLQSAIVNFTWTFTTSGAHVLGLGVLNVVDALNPSGLLLDRFQLNGSLITGGSFESGTLGSFTVIGASAVVTNSFGVPVPDGRFQALLSSGATATIPEPSSLVMLLLGGSALGGFLVRGRRGLAPVA